MKQKHRPQFRCKEAILACMAMAAFASVAIAQPRGGDQIPITNAGFESNQVATNCFQGLTPFGWTIHDPNAIHDGFVDAVGGLNTQPGGPHFIHGAPEGDHVALVFLQGDIGGGPVGLTQVVGAALEANTYTLSAQVGNIASGQGPPPCDVFGFFDLDGFPGYQVQLLAGGVIVGQDNNSLAGTIPEGEFRLSSFQVTIDAAHPQLGEPLEVRVINLNTIDTPENPGIEVDFDDVQLTIGCPANGNMDEDEDIDMDDVPLFVEALLAETPSPEQLNRADVNCSNALDGHDAAVFCNNILD